MIERTDRKLGSRASAAALALLASTVFFVNLGTPKLWDRDEPRNARCASEMLERSDWIVPTFNGELRTHKPVLLYWLMMSSFRLFGTTEFAARFWSATLSVGTVMCPPSAASQGAKGTVRIRLCASTSNSGWGTS